MSTTILMGEINRRIELGEDILRNKQLKTALNQLLKRGLIDDSSIDEIFSDSKKVEVLNDSYEILLIKDKRKELRSPKSHVRNLARFYIEFFSFNTDGMGFNEAFKAAIHRKYDNVYDGEINPKNNYEIRNKFKTYRSITVEIVTEGLKTNPELFPGQKAAQVSLLVRYIRGLVVPSVRIPIERIMFLEDFLSVSRGTFTKKLPCKARLVNEIDTKKRKKPTKRMPPVQLSDSLQKFYIDHSAYRISGKQPEITIIPQEFIGNEKYLRLSEEYKGKWTYNNKGECASQAIFLDALKAFTKFCVTELNIPASSVTLIHLTSVDILEKWKDSVLERKTGGFSVSSLFHIIKKSSGLRGYFRLCGEPGDRDMEEYNLALNLIGTLIPEWSSYLQGGIKKLDPKGNVRFLLDMSTCEMWETIDQAVEWSFQKAKNLALYSLIESIEKAYLLTQSLTILYLSRVKPIRRSNWVNLELNTDHGSFCVEKPSLTYYKKKNMFRLFVPVGDLKNRGRDGINPIDIYYPKSFTPLIQKSLIYRQKYIDLCINKNGQYNHNPKKFVIKYSNNSPGNLDNKFEETPRNFGGRFKNQTKTAIEAILPDVNQKGINHHATRHLAASWYLNEHGDDFVGLATLLNDTLAVTINSYAEIHEKIAQERVTKSIESKNRALDLV